MKYIVLLLHGNSYCFALHEDAVEENLRKLREGMAGSANMALEVNDSNGRLLGCFRYADLSGFYVRNESLEEAENIRVRQRTEDLLHKMKDVVLGEGEEWKEGL